MTSLEDLAAVAAQQFRRQHGKDGLPKGRPTTALGEDPLFVGWADYCPLNVLYDPNAWLRGPVLVASGWKDGRWGRVRRLRGSALAQAKHRLRRDDPLL